MGERFYCEQTIAADTAELSGPEAHHLLHVMRLKEGERVVLFDGAGAEFDAQIRLCRRSSVRLEVLARREVQRERPFPLVLGVALPKGDRQKVLVEKLTELGVTRLVPLETCRSVALPSSGGLGKLRRAVIEACKQCGRNRLMEIADPQPWQDFLQATPASSQRLVAHPGRPALQTPANPTATWCGVGPEGGLSDDEVALAEQQGWRGVALGPTILRVETAAIALAARL